jgi:5-hydroxyisourate hydrolase
MSGISTHVLDLASGKPAAGVLVRLERAQADGFEDVCERLTDADGRAAGLLEGQPLETAVYRITFVIGPYFAGRGLPVFYPEAQVLFVVSDPARHHHIPLLLSPFGYSTYRGS